MAAPVGLEPTATRLTAERSAFELQGNIWRFLSDLHWGLVGLRPTALVYFTKAPVLGFEHR